MALTRGTLDERGQKMLFVSWSRVQTWSKCQQRAVLQRERKVSGIKEGRNFVSGTVADRAMRKWLEQNTEQLPGQMSTYVDELWREHTIDSDEYKVTWKTPDDEKRAKALAKEAVNKLEPFLLARVIPFDYEPEWRFNVRIKIPDIIAGYQRSIVLTGGADIVVHDKDKDTWAIYDLKTTRNENYVYGSTMAQLIFYQIALKLATGADLDRTISAFLTPATEVQYHPLEVTSEDRRLLMSRIVDYAQAIWRQDEPTLTADVNDCYFCECKQWCPRFAVPAKQVNGKKTVSFSEAAELRKNAKARSEKK